MANCIYRGIISPVQTKRSTKIYERNICSHFCTECFCFPRFFFILFLFLLFFIATRNNNTVFYFASSRTSLTYIFVFEFCSNTNWTRAGWTDLINSFGQTELPCQRRAEELNESRIAYIGLSPPLLTPAHSIQNSFPFGVFVSVQYSRYSALIDCCGVRNGACFSDRLLRLPFCFAFGPPFRMFGRSTLREGFLYCYRTILSREKRKRANERTEQQNNDAHTEKKTQTLCGNALARRWEWELERRWTRSLGYFMLILSFDVPTFFRTVFWEADVLSLLSWCAPSRFNRIYLNSPNQHFVSVCQQQSMVRILSISFYIFN